jgi:hypothetical protein
MLTNPPPVFNAASAAWNTAATFDDYASAQRAVDRLSDDGFGVDKLDIVGSDLRLIERVTGRLTKARRGRRRGQRDVGGHRPRARRKSCCACSPERIHSEYFEKQS